MICYWISGLVVSMPVKSTNVLLDKVEDRDSISDGGEQTVTVWGEDEITLTID